eukprot:SAG31_NODE_3086_length_4691_cov_36.726916_1_plen_365_part_00
MSGEIQGVENPANILFRSRSMDENPKKYIDKYTVVQPTIVRAGFARDSAEVTRLDIGEVIKVTEERFTEEQILRVKYKKGWVSVTSKSGKTLLERQDRDKKKKEKRLQVGQSVDTAHTMKRAASEDAANLQRIQRRERKDSQRYLKSVILGDAEIRRREHQIGRLLVDLSLALNSYEKWIEAASKLFGAIDSIGDPLVELAVALAPADDSNEELTSAGEETVTALQEISDSGPAFNDAIREGIVHPAKDALAAIKTVKSKQVEEYSACREEYDIALGRYQKLQRDSSIKSSLDTKFKEASVEVEARHLKYRVAEHDMVSEIVSILGTKAQLEVDFVRVIAEAHKTRSLAAVEALEVLQIHLEDL